MTHWARPRGLKADLRLLTAARLHAIALELEADHAAAVMANLEAAADPTPWPTTTGGAGSSTSPTSPVLAAVERLLSQPKLKPGQQPTTATARAARLLDAIGELARLAATIDLGLAEWSPNRVIAVYPTCGHPIDRAYKRCQVQVDGHQCGAGLTTPIKPKAERRCGTCDKLMQSGQPLDNGECNTCARFRRRKGRARIATSRLALDQGLITEDGTYTEAAGNATG